MSSIPDTTQSPRWLTPIEEQIWHDFMLMNMQLNAVLNKDLVCNTGLSGQDYAVLVALSSRECRSMRIFELSQELGWEKSRLSHHLTRMAQRNLVKKSLSPHDARGAIVHMTTDGQAAIETAAPKHVATVREYFIDLLDEGQLNVLGTITERVLGQLSHETSC